MRVTLELHPEDALILAEKKAQMLPIQAQISAIIESTFRKAGFRPSQVRIVGETETSFDIEVPDELSKAPQPGEPNRIHMPESPAPSEDPKPELPGDPKPEVDPAAVQYLESPR